MAWTHAGFPETVADGADWHNAIGLGGGRSDAFMSVTDLRPTAQAGRVVRLNAGEYVSGGVWSKSDTLINMTALPEQLTAGTSKYHLVVLRKTYGATAATHVVTPVAIPGSASRVIPAFTRTKGTTWDTPVALAKVTAGSTALTELVDLRVIAETTGVFTIFDDLALQLIDRPGAIAHNLNTGETWARVYNSSLGLTWLPLLSKSEYKRTFYDNDPGNRAGGWFQDGTWCEARQSSDGRTTQLQIVLRRIGATIVADDLTGSMPDTLMYTVDDRYKPLDQVVGSGLYYSPSRATYGCLVTLETDGRVFLRAGAPRADLADLSTAGVISIRASFTYIAKGE